MSTRTGYSKTQITLHWLTVIGVLVAFFSHDAMLEISRIRQETGGDAIPTLHTMAGFVVFVLVVIRLIVRAKTGAPEPMGEGAAKAAAEWGHRLIYALVFLIPLMGMATWFGGFTGLGPIHGMLGKLLILVALGHGAMAIFHQFVKKDGTLMRMVRSEPKS